MDFTWISDVSSTRKHPSYLSKPSAAGPSPSLVRPLDNISVRSASASGPGAVRRPRAGTMPAPSSVFPYAESFSSPGSSSLAVPLTLPSGTAPSSSAAATRHRSGSATFTTEGGLGATLFSSALSPSIDASDEGNTIVSTLASLGLDDQDDFDLPSLAITSDPAPPPSSRNRAYTVGTRMERPNITRLLAPSIPFDPFSLEPEQQPTQRPRAISLGMADEPPPQPSFPLQMYQQQQQRLRNTRSSNNLMDVFEEQQSQQHGQQDLVTPASSSSTQSSPSSAAAQIPSRALWLGNITPSLSVADLVQLFSCYGTVESARILSDKECAFVNFTNVESAVAARNDLETRLGSKLQGATVRVGYGKADVSQAMANTTEAGPNAQGPTRALWVGNIPANMNPGILRTIFQPFGMIESVRVLSHKNCGFVNFEQQQDAVRARKALQNKEILGPGTGAVRIGFAKAPAATATPALPEGGDDKLTNLHATLSAASVAAASPDTYQATQWAAAMMMSSMMNGAQQTQATHPTSLYTAIAAERYFIMQQLDHEAVSAQDPSSEDERLPMTYCSAIPLVPELGSDRKLEPLRLREMRKRLDNGQALQEVESMAIECMDEVVELCNDYIGNTVIQKVFEFCSDDTKLLMLERIAPYLASIGVHKNGTWAAQKIIDHANSPALVSVFLNQRLKLTSFLQIRIISTHIAPYVPLLLLDQYGNYVVQCCLRKGPEWSQYIMDAIADKCWEIGQGRFGARAVRAILENPIVPREQQVYVGAAIIQNAVLLTTNANGVLLLVWLLDTSELPGRYGALCPRLLPYLSKLCTHKLGAMTIFKVINQRHDLDARNLLLNALFNDPTLLDDVLRDQVHGLGLIQKIIAADRRDTLVKPVLEALTERLHVKNTQAYKRLFEELEQTTETTNTVEENSNKNHEQWTQSPQAVAMMANMYAAAMATAAANMQQHQQQQPVMPDLTQFDNLIKSLLRNTMNNTNDSADATVDTAMDNTVTDVAKNKTTTNNSKTSDEKKSNAIQE
ncbi:armadillo-type protein [Fennellomyces sp. T-0311]|nr:armadillo-type protein [Fennellomyces sp. T-0311]